MSALRITRTLDEIEAMAEAWLADDKSRCPWSHATARLLGSETAWPLMVYVPKFLKEGAEPQPLDDADTVREYRGRIEFLIEKADNERGISCPKAWEQVNAYRWLFGLDLLPNYRTFGEAADQGRSALENLRLPEGGEGE